MEVRDEALVDALWARNGPGIASGTCTRTCRRRGDWRCPATRWTQGYPQGQSFASFMPGFACQETYLAAGDLPSAIGAFRQAMEVPGEPAPPGGGAATSS